METASPIRPDAFQRLDGTSISVAWARTVVQALDTLWNDCSPADRAILSPLGDFLTRHVRELNARRSVDGGEAKRWHTVAAPTGAYENHPVATTLIQFVASRQPPAISRLTSILVTLAIELDNVDQSHRSHVRTLASVLRGDYEHRRNKGHDRTSPLLVVLAGSESILDMVGRVERQLADHGELVHPRFEQLWRGWLRGQLTRWLADPARLRRSLEPRLAPQMDAPVLPVGIGGPMDLDDATELTNLVVDGAAADEAESTPGSRLRRARLEGLLRASQGDLLSPSALCVPDALITRAMTEGMARARALLQCRDVAAAEQVLALALLAASGIREIDLPDVVWGEGCDGRSPTVHPDRPVLFLPLQRPPHAVAPGPELAEYLSPVADAIPWPLPPTLHRLLRDLVEAGAPVRGERVLPRLANPNVVPYRLRDVMASLAPELRIGAGPVRLALAAEIARRLGPEVAQLVLCDSFSMSLAPCYYCAVKVDDLAIEVASIQQRWFGETIPWTPGDHRRIGSRLIPTDAAAKLWPASLRNALRSASHRKDGRQREEWIAHRNHLAAALVAVTGHRPTNELGELDLDQVVPEYALVILRDKQADALRSTRVAATGRRWVADLRVYLDRLVDIAAGGGEFAPLATAILRSEAPLFSVPGRSGAESLTAATLKASMPEAWQSLANHYRHRLNQALQERGVDPELRHAQMGWVVTPAHATADLAPYSPRNFAERLGPVLDEVMVHDGWYPPTQRTRPWRWDGVPERPIKDWAAEARTHAEEHKDNIRRIREQLRERRKAVMDLVLPRLADVVREFFPALRLDVEKRKLAWADGRRSAAPVVITPDHHALLCERVRSAGDSGDALEAIVARILLYGLIHAARSENLVSGPLPSRPFLSVTAEPSPFLRGLGLAVRQAEALRHAMLARASMGRAHDQGPLALLMVLAFSPYRHLAHAKAALAGAAKASRSQQAGDCLRIPAKVEHRWSSMVLGGVPALFVASRGINAKSARVPDDETLASWIRERLPLPFDLPEEKDTLIEQLTHLLHAAGRLELSGQERLLMLGQVTLAATAVERAVARDDNWPVCTRGAVETPHAENEPATFELVEESTLPSATGAAARSEYGTLTSMLNPDAADSSSDDASDGHHGWRGKLEKRLAGLLLEWGAKTNLALLAGFVLHRLQHGGKVRKKLARRTLHRELTRFGGALLSVVGAKALVSMDVDALQGAYLGVLLGKGTKTRRQAYDAMVMFHEYLVAEHRAPELSWNELSAIAGVRGRGTDPGMLTPNEVSCAYEALKADLSEEMSRSDASPDLIRACELRILLYLVLEASGIRPGSAYGLTLGDIHLHDEGMDFVHVHRSGEYGEAKSVTSVGFIPLEGELWARNRQWVREWLARERGRIDVMLWWEAPACALQAGTRRRFGRAYLTRRIDELLKWATNDRKARTYWLRKTRVTERHRVEMAREAPLARNVHAALCRDGHSTILVPLESYVGDPAVVLGQHLREGRETSRAAILAVTRLDGALLDMAWLRAGGAQAPHRLGVVMARLGMDAAEAPTGFFMCAPPLHRRGALVPRHLDAYARALRDHGDRREALLRSAMTESQADRADAAAQALVLQRGIALWRLDELRQPRAAIPPSRTLDGTAALFSLLDAAPDPYLVCLCNAWAIQAHVARLHDADVLIVLSTLDQVDAADRILAVTGINAQRTTRDGREMLVAPRTQRRTMGHAAALRWVLGLAWIYGRVVGAPSVSLRSSAPC